MKKARITSFSVGRVFNLGNYENWRLDLSVEVPEGRSVRQALAGVMNILRAAKPRGPISDNEYEHAKSMLSDPQAWHKDIKSERKRQKEIRNMVNRAKEIVRQYEVWQAARDRALKQLDCLGASSTWKDHKNDWDMDYDY